MRMLMGRPLHPLRLHITEHPICHRLIIQPILSINLVNPTSYVNPIGVAPSFVPGPVSSYILAASATGSPLYSLSIDDKMADRHVVQEPQNETLQSEEARFDANPLPSSLMECDGIISESKSKDIQMEGEDGSVETGAKETAATNG
eukprot:Gb_24793 [translate_table: standard]